MAGVFIHTQLDKNLERFVSNNEPFYLFEPSNPKNIARYPTLSQSYPACPRPLHPTALSLGGISAMGHPAYFLQLV